MLRSIALILALHAASSFKLPYTRDLTANPICRRSLCRISVAGSAAAAAALAKPRASQASIEVSNAAPQPTIDVNNAGADEFKNVRGLYPTIATKVVQRGPFKTAEDMYAAMDSDVERERLKQYEARFEFGERGAYDRATANRML